MLPPVQRVLEQPVAPVAPLEAFRASLATSRDPSFLAPLTHRVEPSTGGLVDGLVGASGPRVHPLGPDLPVPTHTQVETPPVQRRVGSWPSSAGPETVSASSDQPILEPTTAPAPEANPEAAPEVAPEAAPEARADSLGHSASGAEADVPVPTTGPWPAASTTTTPDTFQTDTPLTSSPPAVTPAAPVLMRTLAAVSDPPPPRTQPLVLPLPQLPVVSRLAATPAAPTRALPVAGVSSGAPVPAAADAADSGTSPQQREESAPLSGFAAAIAAIDHADPAAAAAPSGSESAAPADLPLQRSLVRGPSDGGSSKPPTAAATAVGPTPAQQPVPEVVTTGPLPAEPLAPVDDRPLLGEQPLAAGPDESAGTLPSPSSNASDLAGLDTMTAGAGPGDGEDADPELVVVSRLVEPAGGHPGPPAHAATSVPADVSTLGTAAGRSLAVAQPLAASSALPRPAEVQRVQFLPAGPAAVASFPPTTYASPGRPPSTSVPPAVVAQRTVDGPPAPVTPAPAAVLSRLTDETYPAAVLAPAPVVARSVGGALRGSIADHPQDARSGSTPNVARQVVPGLLSSSGLTAPTAPSPAALLTTPSRSTSFAQMFTPARSSAPGPGAETWVQRDAVEPAAEPAALEPPPAPASPAETPVAPSAAALTAGTAAGATAAAGSSPADVDELARRLYEPLSARLRAELWLDRERAGV